MFMQSTTYETVGTGTATCHFTKYPFKINLFPSIPSIHSPYSDSGSD
jgi:hypothetical protein